MNSPSLIPQPAKSKVNTVMLEGSRRFTALKAISLSERRGERRGGDERGEEGRGEERRKV